LDEIEKAHPDVFNILLQVLDDGRLTDAKGRTVNFKNTVIIMTSNVGSDAIHNLQSVGFKEERSENAKETAETEMRESVMKSLRDRFKPEFLNRLDEIVIFHPVDEKMLSKIVELQIAVVAERLKKQGMSIEVTDTAKSLLATQGYDPSYGARPLKRVIQHKILDPLAMEIINGSIVEGDTIVVDAKKDKIIVEKKG
jgi:ATP-dependent Clp protease ATP-binding subunit ClpC